MVQEAEEGHGDDGGDYIKDWTGKTLPECMKTARDRKRELVRSSVVLDF